MLFLLGGVVLLGGLLLLVYLFVNADPVRLAHNLKWTGIIIAAVAVLALLAFPPARELAALLFPLAMSMPLLARFRRLIDQFRTPRGGQSSTVTTDFLRMALDHDTGTMTGTVLRGQYAGLRIEEMGVGDLIALLRECRAADEESARLLEAYLDRLHPDWRDELASGRTGSAGGGGAGSGSSGEARASGGDMTVDEAYAILGLARGATPEQIKQAHHRLMVKLHPDHGGSDYLATQINRARDVLLRSRV
ncbi:MAG: DnaJ domain-containing protein [Alphaproteobacteria bacterium]|nr:DnaJ domain-containing protein [Alphaproteobacteria bacterium]